MNFLDLMIVLPIAYFTYRGFINGFIREIFGIIGIVIAVYITFEYMGTLTDFLAPYIENRDRATIITGIVTFILILVAVQLIGIALEKLFDMIKLGIINQLSGLIFGALKSAIIISAFLLLLAGIGIPSEETQLNSVAYPVIIQVAPAAFDMIASLIPGTEDFIDTIEKAIQENNSLRNLPIFEKSDT